jgi:hypothetical protein
VGSVAKDVIDETDSAEPRIPQSSQTSCETARAGGDRILYARAGGDRILFSLWPDVAAPLSEQLHEKASKGNIQDQI